MLDSLPQYVPIHAGTCPTPPPACSLQAKAAEKQAALLESTLEQRAKECPFRPQTNTQKRQEQLARILEQPSLGDLGLVLPARAYAPLT